MESLEGGRLGRFRLTHLIGKGGMGEVYAAFDERLERDVAIKVLSSTVDIEPHRRRFLREARLAARLNHPNIASIYEVGESDDRVYIIMELLEGQSLRHLLTESTLSIDEAVVVARDMARAISRAHKGEVIHRDIKPENVFVTRPGPGVLLAKVLDFGLARDNLRKRRDDEPTATDLTNPGEACGTAGYLAPEQARGFAVDVRADVFSFGAVFYEMVTKQRAFQGKDQLSKMLAVVKSQPEPLRRFVPNIQPEIEDIIDCCLAKDPADRFQDGAELLAAIEGVTRTSLRLPSMADLSSSRQPAAKARPSQARTPMAPATPAAVFATPTHPAPRRRPTSISVRPAAEEGPSLAPAYFWAFGGVAGAALIVGTVLIILSLSHRRPLVLAAGEKHTPQVTTTQEPARRSADPVAIAAPPAPEPSFAQSEQAAIPNDAPSAPPTASHVVRLAPRFIAPAASAAARPTSGTILVGIKDIPTILLDGESRRLQNGVVVVPCGRHRVRVGARGEQTVDVPCGGSVIL